MRALLGLTAAIIILPVTAFAADTAIDRPASLFTAETQDDVRIRGVVRAGERVEIAASMTGRLIYAPYRPGQYVARGKTLAKFDCARLEAELTAKRQAHTTLSLRHDSEAELAKYGATGALDVDIARSERDQVAAEIKAMEVMQRDCEIAAPFGAHIAQRHVRAHESPQVGAPIYTLILAGDHEISLIVPARFGASLKRGATLTFAIDETGERVAAKVVRLAPDIDPVSQTREITAKATGKARLTPGMSGTATFDRP